MFVFFLLCLMFSFRRGNWSCSVRRMCWYRLLVTYGIGVLFGIRSIAAGEFGVGSGACIRAWFSGSSVILEKVIFISRENNVGISGS